MPSNATLGEDLLQGNLDLSVFDVSTISCDSPTANDDIGGMSGRSISERVVIYADSGR